ncbi:MAG: hypothetical protein HOV66_03045 [Streptomycetaceae bacterium]|nr:hypothetical protein [Streptomycetaceae bacterium]
MAGRTLAATDVNNKAAACVEQVWIALDQCNQLYKWLTDSAHTDTFLNNLGISGATATAGSDVKLLRDGISDLGSTTNGLWAVAHGLFVPGGTNNFFFNAKNLTGVTYTG